MEDGSTTLVKVERMVDDRSLKLELTGNEGVVTTWLNLRRKDILKKNFKILKQST